jgi:glutaminyl-tRNA synthetase
VIHWLDAASAVPAELRLYDRLFRVPQPSAATLAADLDPDSLAIRRGYVEPAIAASRDDRFQFERLGYFCRDRGRQGLVFNRTVSLRDSWKPAK